MARSSYISRLVPNYQSKARHNLETANVLLKISKEPEMREAIDVGSGYQSYDWVIISAYYAMYHSALSALAKIGYKSANHEATILALEYYYVYEKKILERKYITKIKKARKLEEEYIERLRAARRRRIVAQYDVEESFGAEEANRIVNDAVEFLDRMEKLIYEIG